MRDHDLGMTSSLHLSVTVFSTVLIGDRIDIWKCWVLRRAENWSTLRKTSQSKDENQQQTQPMNNNYCGLFVLHLVADCLALLLFQFTLCGYF